MAFASFNSTSFGILIAYDPFDQATGTLSGTAGSGTWQGSSLWSGDGSVVGGSLSYLNLETDGNHAEVVGQSFRALDTTLGGAGSDIWVSYLVTAPGDNVGISFFLGGSEQNFMGRPGNQWGITNPNVQASGDAGGPHMIVVHLDGINGQATVWLDPALGGATPTGGLIGTGAYTPFTFDTVRLGSFSGWTGSFDELRVGTTWADVSPVPEPSSLSMVVAASAWGAMRLVRRRKM